MIAGKEPIRSFERIFVDDAEKLGHVLARLEREPLIGVDAEMVQRVTRLPGGLQEWNQVLALIQMAAGSTSAVVDPLRAPVNLLAPLLNGPARKIFLGGGQDASLLEQTIGPVRNIADVGEVAYALFGRRQDGMAALTDRIFGLSLDKTIRRADWLKRPINPTLLTYAHRDAELTLLIYHWFEETYPEVLHEHERLVLDPTLPPDAPGWLQDALSRSGIDVTGVVMAAGFDVNDDAEKLAGQLRPYLHKAGSPRIKNRLVRIAGDLGLRSLLPEIVPLAESRSSLLRASAARAIGQLAEPPAGEPFLQKLAEDEIEDVRKAAQAAQKDLNALPGEQAPEEAEDESASLSPAALSALEALKASLDSTP